jgi:hypothetical protein
VLGSEKMWRGDARMIRGEIGLTTVTTLRHGQARSCGQERA